MRFEPLEHHRTTRLDRFREKLTRPITFYLTGLNGIVLTFLGAALLGAAGAVSGALLAIAGGLVATWVSSGTAADTDFIGSYARARGFAVQPRYRLPKATPLLELGGPMLPDGVGYPSREFHGTLRLDDGTEVRCEHATTWLTYRTEPSAFESNVSLPQATMFLVDLPAAAGDFELIVCDAPNGPGTRIACDRLPRLRRVTRDRELFRSHTIFVAEGVRDELVTKILAGGREIRAPSATSWQVAGGHLLVWRMGRIEAAAEMDAALEDVKTLAQAVAAATSRLRERDRPRSRPRRPMDPNGIPAPWRQFAVKRELEYWHHSALRPETGLGSVHPYCGHTLAGSMNGRDASISWVKFVDAVQTERQHRTVTHTMIVLSTLIPEARHVIPPIACTSRRSRYKPFPVASTQGIEPRPSWQPMSQESVRFHRRYVVRSPSEDESILRQLFSPAFLLWHAELELERLGWQFNDGVFVAHTLPKRIDAEALSQVCDKGLHVADRILHEGLEGRF